MGNCLIRNNQISAQAEEYDEQLGEAAVEQMKTSSSFKFEPAEVPEESMKNKKKKKMVRFRLQKDEERSNGICSSDSRSGSVRIRLLVTQDELKRILSYENDYHQQHTSLEQLLSSIKLRGSRICEVGEHDGATNAWRPTLESIPEDRSMNYCSL